ncbi:MAG: peptidoglycan DD-metalloendopeptidase family protein [Stenomitos rutilans HA7619-LM2]|nr:peptidoglycan DD-metalloendopeptidase family protein [Stenomitos rutilans HA7619-LM2]
MERTFPQKVKPVPSCEVEEGVMESQSRQTPLEVNRLVRTSAAVIGLAISVGAYGLPLPNQSDEAVAAEPVTGEPAANVVPQEFDVATVPHNVEQTQNSFSAETVEHTVQEGQTLWQLAQFYGVDAAKVALDNGISTNAVLHVGQVLKISTTKQVSVIAEAAEAAGNRPEYYGLVSGAKAIDANQKTVAQVPYNEVLDALRQKQDRLQQGLTQLKGTQLKDTQQNDRAETNFQAAPETAAATGDPLSPSYTVVTGDTLEAIANAHHVSLKQLTTANALKDPNVLRVNQVLVIPQDVGEASLTPSAEAPVIIASAKPDQMTLPRAGSARLAVDRSQAVTSRPTTVNAEPSVGKASGVSVVSTQSNTVPSAELVPTVSLTHSSVAPTAMGGSTEVATASFVGKQPAQVDQSTSGIQSNYVENLRLEIVKLREKYQGSSGLIQVATVQGTKVAAVPLNVAAPANAATLSNEANAAPQLTPYTKALQAQIRQLQASRQQNKHAEMQAAQADLAPVATPETPQLVATASIGSQNYEPLISSPVGKMVSPDLPPLGSVDAYLPGNSGKFNGYIWPAKGVLTSPYGWRWGRMHKGIDIAAPVGTPVFAAAAGVIITAGWNSGGYGNLVEIQHPDGSVTLYAHNSRLIVREGQQVTQGQQIAEMGSTGYSTGPHSHFEVHLPGQGAVNPMAHLPRGQA